MTVGGSRQVSLDGFTYEVRGVSEGMAKLRMADRVLGTHSGGFVVAPTAHAEAMLAGLAAGVTAGGEEQSGSTAACHDCRRPYGDEHGFPDLVIPSEVWSRISPTGDEGGLLCPSCICARLHEAGITCEGAFMSGPIESVSRPTMSALRWTENLRRDVERLEDLAAAAARPKRGPLRRMVDALRALIRWERRP